MQERYVASKRNQKAPAAVKVVVSIFSYDGGRLWKG
jgi:hypothetical protein